MIFRLKVKRGWDQACEKAEIAFGACGILRGQTVRLCSVEMSTSHLLTLELAPCERGESEALPQIKFWLRSMIRAHR